MENLRKISPFRLSSLLRLEKNPKLALQIFESSSDVKSFRYSRRSYDLIISKLGRAKMFDPMEKILDQMKKETRFSPKEILFCNVISYYGRSRRSDSAVHMYDRIPSFNCQRTVKSLNSLLNALLNCQEFEKIEEIYANLDQYAVPDACTYNILINACCLNDSLDCAWSLFEEMRRNGIQPNVITFGTLVSALCSNSKLDEAFRLKDEMMEVFRVNPNVFVYTSLIKGLCQTNKLGLALKLKDELVVNNKTGLDSAVYSTLMGALFRAGRKGEVVGILEEMKQNGCKPDTVTYNAMIAGFCGEMDFPAAFGVLDMMLKEGCKPDVISYNTIISGFCKAGRLSEARDLFEDMPRRECCPDVVTYRTLFRSLCDGKQFDETVFLLDEMLFKGFTPHVESTHKFLKALYMEEEMELLGTVLCSLIKHDAVGLNTWDTVIGMICKNQLKACEFVDSLGNS
ncbi:putative pentatricopeptide repeat-containing protein At1g53330 [Aristolochia californica]|uniref:putative pentatricopeptide repeat-containing protein At1g53330 n=1 Tax=Aristolochia californica TaxID=171875 RepID=UPI0035DF3522